MMKGLYWIAALVSLLSLVLGTACAFATTTSSDPHHVVWATTTRLHVSASHSGKRKHQKTSQQNGDFDFLMDDFKTLDGELLNPYKVLKVPREADRMQIKQAYRSLCRRYHPDGVRHREILPGSCDNLEQVADHWERIKLSYEILSDPMRRKRYDRAEVLSNPGMALRRAMGRAAIEGAASFGRGIFGLGASVMQHVVTKTTVSVQQQQQSSSRDSSSNSNSNEQLVSKEQIAENV